jgi:four helix bundle protein
LLVTSESVPKRPKTGLAAFDAYTVALEFYREVRKALRGRRGHVAQQLSDSAESIVLNVAEAYPTVGPDRARRFRIVENEASECAGALDILEVRGELSAETLVTLRGLLDRECAMLWRLSRP